MQWFSEIFLPLLGGVPVTVALTIGGAFAALVVSFVAGLLRLSNNRIVRGVTRVYVEFFRGTSLLVQLFWMFYALPQITGFRIESFPIAVITFGLSYGAYGSEVVRGSILAVPRAQWEATTALSYTPYDRMRRVILPQAIPLMLPSFGNLLIELMKGTALVYLITETDLTGAARDLRVTMSDQSFAIFTTTLVIYFVIGVLLSRGVRLLERRANANVGRPQPPIVRVKWLMGRKAAAQAGGAA